MLEVGPEGITAHLMPTVNYTPQQQGILRNLLAAKNQEGLVFPDGSGRKLTLRLGNRSDVRITLETPPSAASLGGPRTA